MDVLNLWRGVINSMILFCNDRPYALSTIDELPKIIIEKGLLKPGGWFVLETYSSQ